MSSPHRRHRVNVEEDVGALRRDVVEAVRLLPGVRAGEVGLAATELATNLVRHVPDGGYVLWRTFEHGIELVSVDRGPGMLPGDRLASVRALSSGTRPGLGVGLAGVERLASTFDVYSVRGQGSIVLARLGSEPPPGPFRWGGVNVPVDGRWSGDGWAVAADHSLTAVLVDGLGHGLEAAAAAQAAERALGPVPVADLAAFVGRAHEAMRDTRGGVLAAATVVPDVGYLVYAGVGNIAGRIHSAGESKSLVSREGTLGTTDRPPPARVERYPWPPRATLVLASDGLEPRWDLRDYPGLLGHHPVVVAAVLYRDLGRMGDDAAVLVVEDVRSLQGPSEADDPAGGTDRKA